MDDVEVEVELGSVQVEGCRCWWALGGVSGRGLWAREGRSASGWQQRSANVGQASAAHGCLEVLSVRLSAQSVSACLSATWELYLTSHLRRRPGQLLWDFRPNMRPVELVQRLPAGLLSTEQLLPGSASEQGIRRGHRISLCFLIDICLFSAS